MSRFYASIQGNRGEATRQGHAKSGIEGHIRGFNFGVKVWGFVDNDGRDAFRVELTGGSNKPGEVYRNLGCFVREEIEAAQEAKDRAEASKPATECISSDQTPLE